MTEFTAQAEGIHSTRVETVHLVGIQFPGSPKSDADEHIEELKRLVHTLGFRVTGQTIVHLRSPSSRLLIGSGKAEEITDAAKAEEADCIVFDEELSPPQQRNWESLSGLCVIDRHEVILDIFAEHATTREAVLQVALARAEYSLPRLTRAWTHLSRQRGGRRGTRGEGEMQLEVDRRIVLRKISRFKRELAILGRQRALRRSQRESVPVPTAAIVGYTNAGKSSLLNALTGADVGVEDKLFATLDATTRKLSISNGQDLLLTDTVGFIRKLPHDLVDAFKSTLEEAAVSDFLILVLDANDPAIEHQYETTLTVIEEIGAADRPRIVVLNKIDAVNDTETEARISHLFPDAHRISAKTGAGLDELTGMLRSLEYERDPVTSFALPASRHDLAALIHRTGRIVGETYEDDRILVTAQVPEKTRGKLKSYIVTV